MNKDFPYINFLFFCDSVFVWFFFLLNHFWNLSAKQYHLSRPASFLGHTPK